MTNPVDAQVSIYTGFGTTAYAAVDGRVIGDKEADSPQANDSVWKNLRRNLGLFSKDERRLQAVSIAIDERQMVDNDR